MFKISNKSVSVYLFSECVIKYVVSLYCVTLIVVSSQLNYIIAITVTICPRLNGVKYEILNLIFNL